MQWRVRVSLSPYQRQTRQFANPFDQNCSVYQAVLQSKRKKYQHVTQSSPSENQMTKQSIILVFHFIKEQIIKYSIYSITEFQKSSGNHLAKQRHGQYLVHKVHQNKTINT